ncbi:hypothetical protein AV521_27375 [Streptomyces sp. IMTB 2501]|nr:hypothetical protein AV521_27375 [Streptomyces sp. IMTB 2501]
MVPPWGGELAIDLLPSLDFEARGRAEPTWGVGHSDMSTVITPLTLRTGIAAVHGNNLMDTPYLDTSRCAGDESLLVHAEACEDKAFTICRHLHGMRLAGFFDRAAAVLVGRTHPDSRTLTQYEAVLDALGPLGVPIAADVECGHVAPFLPLVNGARGRVVHTAARSEIVQTLG